MRKLLLVPILVICGNIFSQTLQQIESKRIGLPNGWSLTPVGKSLPLGDLPLNMAVSPSKKLVAVTNNGQSVHSLQLIDAVTDKVLVTTEIKKGWYGLKFSADEKFLYASGGHDNWILKFAIYNVRETIISPHTKQPPGKLVGRKLQLIDSIKLGDKWPNKIGPAGIETDDARKIMYVVTREDK